MMIHRVLLVHLLKALLVKDMAGGLDGAEGLDVAGDWTWQRN